MTNCWGGTHFLTSSEVKVHGYLPSGHPQGWSQPFTGHLHDLKVAKKCYMHFKLRFEWLSSSLLNLYVLLPRYGVGYESGNSKFITARRGQFFHWTESYVNLKPFTFVLSFRRQLLRRVLNRKTVVATSAIG